MLIGLVRLLLNRHDRWNLGSLIVNVVVVFSVIVYFAVDFNEEDEAVESTNKTDIITIHRDTNMNSSSIVDGFGDTILQKVGDSIIVDKTSEWARERDR